MDKNHHKQEEEEEDKEDKNENENKNESEMGRGKGCVETREDRRRIINHTIRGNVKKLLRSSTAADARVKFEM